MSFDRPSRGGLDSEPVTSRGRRQARRRAGADSNQPEWVVIQTFTRVGLTQEAQQIQISPENRACEACASCIPGAHCERKALRPAGCSWQPLCSGIQCKRRWASCVSPTYTGYTGCGDPLKVAFTRGSSEPAGGYRARHPARRADRNPPSELIATIHNASVRRLDLDLARHNRWSTLAPWRKGGLPWLHRYNEVSLICPVLVSNRICDPQVPEDDTRGHLASFHFASNRADRHTAIDGDAIVEQSIVGASNHRLSCRDG